MVLCMAYLSVVGTKERAVSCSDNHRLPEAFKL